MENICCNGVISRKHVLIVSSVSTESRSSSASPAGLWQGKRGLGFHLGSACSEQQMVSEREWLSRGAVLGVRLLPGMLAVCAILGGVLSWCEKGRV